MKDPRIPQPLSQEDEELIEEVCRDKRISLPPQAEPDNWQQYAKEGENAQQCIERHRAELDGFMTLYINKGTDSKEILGLVKQWEAAASATQRAAAHKGQELPEPEYTAQKTAWAALESALASALCAAQAEPRGELTDEVITRCLQATVCEGENVGFYLNLAFEKDSGQVAMIMAREIVRVIVGAALSAQPVQQAAGVQEDKP